MKLTNAIASDHDLAGKSEAVLPDDDVRGFGARIRPGSRSWVFIYRNQAGQQKKVTIGPIPGMDVSIARKIASRHQAEVTLGQDPAAEKQKKETQAKQDAAETFLVAAERFLAEQGKSVRPATLNALRRHLLDYCVDFHNQGLRSIGKRDVANLLDKLTARGKDGRSTSNITRTTLVGFWKWAISKDLADTNPARDTMPIKAGKDDRTSRRALKDHELAELWSASTCREYATILRLLILTGLRRDEISDLGWSEVNFDEKIIDDNGKLLAHGTITIPGRRTKNGLTHLVPMSTQVRAILEGLRNAEVATDGRAVRATGRDFIFGARGKAGGFNKHGREKAALLRLNLEPWTLHDLRHTFSTKAHGKPLSIAPHIIEACMNHVSGHKGGVAGVYNHNEYREEKAEALQRWADYVTSIVEPVAEAA